MEGGALEFLEAADTSDDEEDDDAFDNQKFVSELNEE